MRVAQGEDGRTPRLAPARVGFPQLGGEYLGFIATGEHGVTLLPLVDEPKVVVAFQFTPEILVFEDVNGMGGDDHCIQFVVLECPIAGVSVGQVDVGHYDVVIGQALRQEVQQAVFTFVYRSIAVYGCFDGCHEDISFSRMVMALVSISKASLKLFEWFTTMALTVSNIS